MNDKGKQKGSARHAYIDPISYVMSVKFLSSPGDGWAKELFFKLAEMVFPYVDLPFSVTHSGSMPGSSNSGGISTFYEPDTPHNALGCVADYDFVYSIPGYAWGMALTKEQAQMLGGFEALRENAVFRAVEQCKNGGVYFQLTQDINDCPADKVKALEKLMFPFMRSTAFKSAWFNICFLSYRMPLEEQDIQFEFHPWLNYTSILLHE